ncbi:MAG TPA: MFS transporter [Casimicrobiaceae bacterium]|jgi:ATP:ADP antiporter, AAA family|nr:MFS transporter [Casimicrobiaceae bacterium]
MESSLARRALSRVVAVQPEEVRALTWSFAYFFCLLAGYYVLRPLRDEMGIAGGVRNLQWMFTATFVVMLAAVPLFGWVVATLPRRRFIPLVYHFFVVNIAIFWLLMTLGVSVPIVARVFFVWISVFNLFAVSVFWSFMADLYTSEQGKRLFGFIAAGGSAGALLGPAITVALAVPLGHVNLLIVAALLLELAVLCARRLEAVAPARQDAPRPAEGKGLGGGWLAGLAMVLRSPYLAGIALWVLLLSIAGTFLYFQQANIVAAASDDPAVRTRIFATIDLVVGILTIIVQCLATGPLIARFGVGRAAAFLPLVFGVGFLVLAWTPALFVVIAFQALQRTANFAVSNPAREVLFTVLDREEKYKAKNVIDIVVFRGADAVAGWLFSALRGAGLGLTAISLVAVPLCAAWLGLALALGRAQEARARATAGSGVSQPA